VTEEVVDKCHKKISNYANEWILILSKLDLTKPQSRIIDRILDNFKQESDILLDGWRSKIQVESGTHQQGKYVMSSTMIKQMMENSKKKWLRSVLQIEEIVNLLAHNGSPLRGQATEKTYEFIFNSLIEFQKAQIIPEEDLSYFWNNGENGRLLSAYATSKYTRVDPSTETAYVNLNIKQSLEMSTFIDHFPHLLKCK
jgi:hypothetical protein